jgi:DNA-binding transcriptional ArsR family regulator
LCGAAKAAPGVTDPTGRVFDALADPNRRYVVQELAAELPVTRQAVAKHLAALNEAGLVASRREGRETRYELTPGPLASAMDWMAGVGAQWDSRLARLQRHLTGGSPTRRDGAKRRE